MVRIDLPNRWKEIQDKPLVLYDHYVVGRWYANTLPLSTVTTVTPPSNTLRFIGFYFSRSIRITQLAIDVDTAGTTGSKRCRIGVYDSLDRYPNRLLFDSGDISVATTGSKIVSTNLTFNANNIYFFAYVTDSNAGYSAPNQLAYVGLFGLTNPNAPHRNGYEVSYTYSPLLDVAPSGASLTASHNIVFFYVGELL